MFYITGDTHRNFKGIKLFTERFNTTKDDVMIILGDVGINYCGKYEDDNLKRYLNRLPITLLCVRGNHEERPENILTYHKSKIYNNNFEANCFTEIEFPSLYFLDDGEMKIFSDGKEYSCFVVNGAYSVDKHYRLMNGGAWFKDEQLTTEEREHLLLTVPEKVDFVFSHTCPEKYIPSEMFLPQIDQSLVDRTMEEFLDKIEDKLEYQKWFCGHWHTNKNMHKIRFMFDDILALEDITGRI